MTNAELISMVRSIAKHGADWRINEVLNRAADALEAADKKIEELEAQIPKRGEWIAVKDWLQIPQEDSGTYRCSACGQVMKYPWNYCPNCGAKMKKGEQENE